MLLKEKLLNIFKIEAKRSLQGETAPNSPNSQKSDQEIDVSKPPRDMKTRTVARRYKVPTSHDDSA